jgi:hypothetical protein
LEHAAVPEHPIYCRYADDRARLGELRQSDVADVHGHHGSHHPLQGQGDNPLEAVFRYQAGRWVYAKIHGAGSFNADNLVFYHVPRSVAAKLVSALQAVERSNH